jgi:hypothetical protein
VPPCRDERRGAAVDLVGAHDLQRVDELGPAVRGPDRGSEERRRQLFAAAHHRVARARLEMPQHADRAAQLVELGGGPIDLGQDGAEIPPIFHGELRRGPMTAAKGLGGLLRGLELPHRRLCCGVEQQIRDAAERRSHDCQPPFVRRYPRRRTLDGLAVRERGAAELPHFELSSRHHLLLSKRNHEDAKTRRTTRSPYWLSRVTPAMRLRVTLRALRVFVVLVVTSRRGSPCAAAATPPPGPARSCRRDAASS